MSSLLMDEALETKGMTIAETVQEGKSVLEGWLVKRGSAVKSLKKRWFILSKGQLQYFEDKQKASDGEYLQLDLKGTFELVNGSAGPSREAYERFVLGDGTAPEKKKKGALGNMMSALSLSKSEDADPSLSFVVRSCGRVLVLYASSKDDMDTWIKAISRCIVIDVKLTQWPPPSKNGWLVKSAANDPEAKLRFVQLYTNRLDYFEDSTAEMPKMSVELTNTRVGITRSAKTERLTRMFVGVKAGLWYFEAANALEAEEWLDAIKASCQYTKEFVPNDHDGFLIKAGAGNRRTWFVATPGKLRWFADEAQTSVQGEANLSGAEVEVVPPPEDDPDKCTFKVTCGGQTLELGAADSDVMDAWVEAIKRNAAPPAAAEE